MIRMRSKSTITVFAGNGVPAFWGSVKARAPVPGHSSLLCIGYLALDLSMGNRRNYFSPSLLNRQIHRPTSSQRRAVSLFSPSQIFYLHRRSDEGLSVQLHERGMDVDYYDIRQQYQRLILRGMCIQSCRRTNKFS